MWRLIPCAMLVSPFLLTAAESDSYAGAQSCAQCHPAQSKAQATTGHASALRAVSSHPALSLLPVEHTAYRPPGFRLTWSRSGNNASVTASDGSSERRLPVQWAFGAGSQAITFVSQLDEDHYVEHHSSWYRAGATLALTPGHRGRAAASLDEAFGVRYRTFAPDAAILRCFRCHSTGRLRLTASLAVDPAEPGVRCEACHGAGKEHVRKPSTGNIFNPSSLTGAGMNNYCGNCHRPPASDPGSIDWSDSWNVRHQPVYLSVSACFTASAGKLRCTTCHDPHRPLERSAATYNARCSSCHAEPPQWCVTGGGNCVSCHMPAVKPHQTLSFTNHTIGVYGNNRLQPQRQRR